VEALRPKGKDVRAVWRLPFGEVPEWLIESGQRVDANAQTLGGMVEDLCDLLREALTDGKVAKDSAESLIADLLDAHGQLEAVSTTWCLMTQDKPHAEALPMARWIESRQGHTGVDFRVCASPISAAGLLKELLWNHATGVLLTSATLTALGEFRRFAQLTGLQWVEGVRYLQLPSPFDYEHRAVLDIPPLAVEPKAVEAHTHAVIQWLNQHLARREGSLVLFTSYRQMKDVYEALHPDLKRITRMQGQQSKGVMLREHCAAIDEGSGAILFGVDSLSEGVDLPGHYLRHVVIAKLPFSVPSTPVLEAMAEWLESQGRNPFIEMAVPDVSTKLTQAVGRLLRTENDHGRISILDTRLLTKTYGKRLINALPRMGRLGAAA
jgi:ATP-dependent DNA helicase DinG